MAKGVEHAAFGSGKSEIWPRVTQMKIHNGLAVKL